MPIRNTDHAWGSINKAFHWILALLIIGMGFLGWYMTWLPNAPGKIKIYALHKSIGLTILALALLRVLWRQFDRRPPELPMPHWQHVAARAVHIALYGVMLLMPLSGWLFNSAGNFPLQWFGLFHVPSLTNGENPTLKAIAGITHLLLFWVLLVAFILHAGGALKHHFIDRDSTLRRMVPWGARAEKSTPSPAPITVNFIENSSLPPEVKP